MRVLLVSPYPDPRWLSMERYAARLALGTEGIDFRDAHGSYFRPSPALRWALPMYWGRPALRSAQANGCDLVHVTDHALAHHVGLFAGWPTITTCHDLIPLHFPMSGYSPARRLRRVLYLRSTQAMRRAAPLIAVSEATKRDMLGILDIDPSVIDVVPVVIPHDFAPLEGAEAILASSGVVLPPGPRVLSIGHTGGSKNLELLFAALATVELKGAAVVRVGRKLPPALRAELARQGLEHRVIELGNVPPQVLLALYNTCDVLAQPSWLEGFGIPVAEAQACGLPVVCSDGGALPEVGGDAARIVPLEGKLGSAVDPGTASRFAAALAEVISDATVASRMRTLGFEQVKQFRPEAVAPRLVGAYRRAVSRWHAS